MIALAVDDEKPMLSALIRAVEASSDVTSVIGFSSCTAALEWAKENKADVAFLDISMRGMGGLHWRRIYLQSGRSVRLFSVQGMPSMQ